MKRAFAPTLATMTLGLAVTQPAGPAAAEAPAVLVTISPLHSLVASVMQGVGEPDLLMEGAQSPHTIVLRPSDAEQLEQADTVFWIGHLLETPLEGPIETLASDAHVVSLMEAEGLTLLAFSDDHGHDHGAHDDHHDHDDHGEKAHAHDDHDSDHDHGHDEHGHDDHGHDDHGHGEEEHAHHDHDHGDHDHGEEEHAHDGHDEHDHGEEEHAHDDHGHHGHDHSGADPHIWLDPENAKVMVKAIEGALISADPNHATDYVTNAAATIERLDALTAEMQTTLEPVTDRSYIVFHDAYQYFEKRFGMSPAGAITISPEREPGARSIQEIREKAVETDAVCIFAEPQFPPRLVNIVAEGSELRTGTLDPVGADLEPGPDLYFELIRAMGQSFRDCLSAG